MTLYGIIVLALLGQADYLNLVQRGRAEYRSGDFVASEKLFLGALGMLQPNDEIRRAATLGELGDVYANEEKLSKAERAYSESLAICRRLSDPSGTVLMLRNLGATYSLERRDDDALRLLREALKLAKSSPKPNVAFMAEVLNSLGVAYYRQDKYGKAEAFFFQALKTISASGVPFDKAGLLNNLGVVYLARHKSEMAEDFLKQALRLRENHVGPLHPDLIGTLNALGVLYTEIGKYAEAEDQFQRALKILEAHGSNLDIRIARILHALTGAYIKAGRKADADAAIAEAVLIARRNLNEHPDMIAIIEDYSVILRNQGKTMEAEELRLQAKRARAASSLIINAHSPF